MIDERLLSPEEFASMSQVFPEGFTGRVGLMIAKAQLAKCDAECASKCTAAFNTGLDMANKECQQRIDK